SPGVPAANADLTLTLPYNDLEAAKALFAEQGHELAALIIEPVAGNMNCIPPMEGYLQSLRELCTKSDTVLIFDEVMTGFRVALGGAQAHYGVTPDLTTFGKIIGGGMPVGAYGGRRDLMEQIAPAGPIYQAGTLSGNPVAMAAGLAMLELIQTSGFHERLAARTRLLADGLQMMAAVARFNRFFHGMLKRGVYLAPSAFEAGFMSSAHNDQDIADTLEAARGAMREAKG